jgi:hypothetical protein
MALRTCVVRFNDLDAVQHTTEVTAETLYEAACLAVRVFREFGIIDQSPGAGTRLEIEVKSPTVRHVVTVGQVQRWVQIASSNPNEEAKRRRLREILQVK